MGRFSFGIFKLLFYIWGMKTIKFRPLRRIKKTGKITVASYMQWRNLMTADYREFNLILSEEHKAFPKDEYVYNHKGEVLFFFDYNPLDVPVFQHTFLTDIKTIMENNKSYGII